MLFDPDRGISTASGRLGAATGRVRRCRPRAVPARDGRRRPRRRRLDPRASWGTRRLRRDVPGSGSRRSRGPDRSPASRSPRRRPRLRRCRSAVPRRRDGRTRMRAGDACGRSNARGESSPSPRRSTTRCSSRPTAPSASPRSRTVPWGADMVARESLADVYLLVMTTATARQASRQSATIALSGAGAALFLAFGGLVPGSVRRATIVVNVAAAVAIANSTRLAIDLANRPLPAAQAGDPWHSLEPGTVLARLGTTTDGLSASDAERRSRPAPRPEPTGTRLRARRGRGILGSAHARARSRRRARRCSAARTGTPRSSSS